MNTKAITNKMMMGIVMSSLIMGAVAFVPFSADAATKEKTANIQCVRDAVRAREDLLQGAYRELTKSIIGGLETRQGDLVKAWGIAGKTERKAAIKKAFLDWRTTAKTAHASMTADRTRAWSTYRTTMKDTCKADSADIEKADKASTDTVAI